MSCRTYTHGDVTFIACSRGAKPCVSCGDRSTKLCDFPLRGTKAGKTCDAAICARCAVAAGKNVDYCPPHGRLMAKQEAAR